ncbi:MAG: type 1 fimbrial protein [Stenotrophomonas sp.]|nr:type 1 fimbrial protein [Stenotrophomonas sp.]
MRRITGVLGMAIASLAGGAAAQQGQISFDGLVVGATCVISSNSGGGSGPDFAVPLPSVPRTELSREGERATPIPFFVVIGSGERPCLHPRLRALFRNVGHTNAAGRLINQGSARNVDVVVMNTNGDDVNLLTNENSLVVPIDRRGIGVLRWDATYYATAAAGPGSVRAQVEYVITYP